MLTVSQKTPKTDRKQIPVIPVGGAGPGAGTAWRSWTLTGEPEPGGAKTPKTDRKQIPVIPVGGAGPGARTASRSWKLTREPEPGGQNTQNRPEKKSGCSRRGGKLEAPLPCKSELGAGAFAGVRCLVVSGVLEGFGLGIRYSHPTSATHIQVVLPFC